MPKAHRHGGLLNALEHLPGKAPVGSDARSHIRSGRVREKAQYIWLADNKIHEVVEF